MPSNQTQQTVMAGHRGRPSEHTHAAPAGDALAALRTSGRRLTRQRSLIWNTLLDNQGLHLSATDIAHAVRKYDSGLHQATIYRTLDTLVEDGLLVRTDLGADRSYYELASDHRHHHLVCTQCAMVVHVHDDIVATMFEHLAQTTGFTVTHELTLQGLCETCPSS